MLTVEKSNKFDWKTIPLYDCAKGNAIDTYFTLKIFGKLYDELENKKLLKLYTKLIAPTVPIFTEMEYEGLRIDTNKLAELKSQIKSKIDFLTVEMMKSDFIPKEANLNSGDDLIEILFSIRKNKDSKEYDIVDKGLGLFPFEFTDKGKPSTDEETMTELKDMVEEEYSRRGLNEKQGL